MLQIIIFSLLAILFMLATLELFARVCVRNESGTWRKCVVISAPVQTIRNKIQGIKTLKEEVSEQDANKPTDTQVASV